MCIEVSWQEGPASEDSPGFLGIPMDQIAFAQIVPSVLNFSPIQPGATFDHKTVHPAVIGGRFANNLRSGSWRGIGYPLSVLKIVSGTKTRNIQTKAGQAAPAGIELLERDSSLLKRNILVRDFCGPWFLESQIKKNPC